MLKKLFKMLNQDPKTQEYIQKGAIILDVRTPEEYEEGHDARSILIPLNELVARVDELDKSKPIVAVCRSGARSQSATDFLEAQGFDVVNGGPWDSI